MTKRMLIDASHTEETRVVVLDGNRLEEFDLEVANRMPLKGNIYLAKVVRVEPSLQAAFVEYGGNRHGFLAFGEIHPDYYQLPVADRQRLLEMQAAEAREYEEREAEEEERAVRRQAMQAADAALNDALEAATETAEETEAPSDAVSEAPGETSLQTEAMPVAEDIAEPWPESLADAEPPVADRPAAEPLPALAEGTPAEELPAASIAAAAEGTEDAATETAQDARDTLGAAEDDEDEEEAPPPETIGGEGPEEGEGRERRIPPRFLRHYKIQEVIRRRQVMLVQVVKEERGTKGAALTTYISLAGRFSVLMPNSPRAGGVSRKITSVADRKRLREVIDDLSLPRGMSIIVRTAGAQRPKPEIRRDCEYLLRLWDNIRERTLASSAPALIYEEADLIKRSIRDTFSRDVEEILVDGEHAFQEAREFMRMLMPQHARKIQAWRDGGVPLFAKHQVEQQLDAMHSPTVQLRSGGYLVINQTEALVAIDVNSGRATRERHIEDTALRTNLEAADEIARQLRLRDLAGLIVIDFIDMESSKHDGMVERRLKEALRHDRARIQVGRISHFGLLEMSRQRLRPSLAETTFVTCPHCQGRGTVRSLESSALQVLRAIEEEGAKQRAAEIVVHVAASCALYLLNRKRDRLAQIEERFGMSVLFEPDEALLPPNLRIERTRAADPDRPREEKRALRMDYAPEPEVIEAEAEDVEEEAEAAEAPRPNGHAKPEGADARGEGEGRRRRRRRRRGGRREDGTPGQSQDAAAEGDEGEDEAEGEAAEGEAPAEAADGAERTDAERTEAERAEGEREGRRRRRGRRGGRGRREDGSPRVEGAAEDGAEPGDEAEAAEGGPMPAPPPAPAPRAPRYQGPTPADPFAGQVDDIFAAMEAAERAAEEAAMRPALRPQPAPPVLPTPPAADPQPPHVAVTEPVPAEQPAIEVVAATEVAPPAPEPAPVQAAPAPEPEPAPAEPVQGVVVQPVSVDALDEAAPKKRGWWKR